MAKAVEGTPEEIRAAAEAFPEDGGWGAANGSPKSIEAWNSRQREFQRAFILGMRKANECKREP